MGGGGRFDSPGRLRDKDKEGRIRIVIFDGQSRDRRSDVADIYYIYICVYVYVYA